MIQGILSPGSPNQFRKHCPSVPIRSRRPNLENIVRYLRIDVEIPLKKEIKRRNVSYNQPLRRAVKEL